MVEISNFFDDRHIMQLARSLSKLEFGSTCGNGFIDAIWKAFSSLRSLWSLEIDPSSPTTELCVGFHGQACQCDGSTLSRDI